MSIYLPDGVRPTYGILSLPLKPKKVNRSLENVIDKVALECRKQAEEVKKQVEVLVQEGKFKEAFLSASEISGCFELKIWSLTLVAEGLREVDDYERAFEIADEMGNMRAQMENFRNAFKENVDPNINGCNSSISSGSSQSSDGSSSSSYISIYSSNRSSYSNYSSNCSNSLKKVKY